MDTKVCTKCKVEKPLSEFYKGKGYKYGRYAVCKKCLKDKYHNDETFRQAKLEYARNYRKKINQDPDLHKKKVNNERQRYKQRCLDPEYREQLNQYQRDYRKRVKSKKAPKNVRKAHKAVEVAVRKGKLPKIDTQTCKQCDSVANHYHHYKGYDKKYWLDVVPLCARCHGKTWRQLVP
jgi:hypothetical protein